MSHLRAAANARERERRWATRGTGRGQTGLAEVRLHAICKMSRS